MVPMGVNDMHAIHVESKILHVYVQLYLLCELAIEQLFC